jgi:tetratricopeptide (TPR) repeat protein
MRAFIFFFILSFFFILNTFAYQSIPRETVWDEIMFEQSIINMRRGVYYMEGENYVDAANEFIKAISKNPYDANAHIFYGSSLYWLGDVDKALKEYELALKFDSKNPLAFQLMAIAYAWKGEMPKSLKYFLEAEKYGPQRSDIKMNLGSVYHSLGKFDKSLFYFRKALKLEPKNPLYNFQLGTLYKRLGRYYDSLHYMETAAHYDRNYEDAFFELGTIYEKLANKDKAISSYKRALYLKPLDGAARFRLAVILLKSGQFEKIKKYLIEAFNLTPKNEKGGISLNLVYSGKAKNRKKQTATDNERQANGNKFSKDDESENNILNSIESSLRKIADDEDIKLKVEFLSLPKTKIVSASNEKKGSLSAGLTKRLAEDSGISKKMSNVFNKEKVSYKKSEYSINEIDAQKKEERISEIIGEIDRILSGSGENNDIRISVSIETNKRRSSSQGSSESSSPLEDGASKVAYNPRIVGNDMGLWVVGRNWLENVQDGLIELEDFLALSSSPEPISHAVTGLGNLILGEANRAEDDFENIKLSLPLLYNLGMSVMSVEKGNEKKALYYCKEVLKIDPKNKVALRNKKWLEIPTNREHRGESRE